MYPQIMPAIYLALWVHVAHARHHTLIAWDCKSYVRCLYGYSLYIKVILYIVRKYCLTSGWVIVTYWRCFGYIYWQTLVDFFLGGNRCSSGFPEEHIHPFLGEYPSPARSSPRSNLSKIAQSSLRRSCPAFFVFRTVSTGFPWATDVCNTPD